jgi:hypothetical protein
MKTKQETQQKHKEREEKIAFRDFKGEFPVVLLDWDILNDQQLAICLEEEEE